MSVWAVIALLTVIALLGTFSVWLYWPLNDAKLLDRERSNRHLRIQRDILELRNTIRDRPGDLADPVREALRGLAEDVDHRLFDPDADIQRYRELVPPTSDEVHQAILTLQRTIPLTDLSDEARQEMRELARMILQPLDEPPLRGTGNPGVIDFDSEMPLPTLVAHILQKKREQPTEPEPPSLWDRLNED